MIIIVLIVHDDCVLSPFLDVISTRESLLFNHEQTPEEIAENVREARETLNQLCEQTTTDVRPETPALFADLVRKMRKLDARSLTRIHSAAESICKKAE